MSTVSHTVLPPRKMTKRQAVDAFNDLVLRVHGIKARFPNLLNVDNVKTDEAICCFFDLYVSIVGASFDYQELFDRENWRRLVNEIQRQQKK